MAQGGRRLLPLRQDHHPPAEVRLLENQCVNMDEFMCLANKIVDVADRESMAILEALQLKWKAKFGSQFAEPLRLKPVSERESTDGLHGTKESWPRIWGIGYSGRGLDSAFPWLPPAKVASPRLESEAGHLPDVGIAEPMISVSCIYGGGDRGWPMALPGAANCASMLGTGAIVASAKTYKDSANCMDGKKRPASVPISVYVRKEKTINADVSIGGAEVDRQIGELADDVASDRCNKEEVGKGHSQGHVVLDKASHSRHGHSAQISPGSEGEERLKQQTESVKGKEIVLFNPFQPARFYYMISMASWNVRGLNSLGHQEAVGELVRDHKLQFLGLIETRVGLPNVQGFGHTYLIPGRGLMTMEVRGGIWLAWNNQEVDVEVLKVETQFIHCKATNKRMHTTCLISVIYGECDIVVRRALWTGLQRIEDEVQDVPWILLGDFNAVVDASEVCGNAADTRASMNEFREFITMAGLVHLPFTGCPFTWHNCSEGNRSLWKRLDRVLVNEAWLECWPQASYLSALPKTSDHSPLVLIGTERSAEHSPFRFDNFLAHQEGFLDLVTSVWRHPIYGTKMYGVISKMKTLKPVFRQKRKEKGDLSANVQQAKDFLEKAQSLYERHKGELLLLLVKCCRMIYCAAVTMEKRMLQQRAKLRWLKHGDQSSKSLLGGTRRSTEISLTELQSGAKYLLSVEDGARLIAPITNEEIKEAFFDISEDSAPGPDGYTSLFFKAAWVAIGGDFVKLSRNFSYRAGSLRMFNFPTKFIGWIEQCISTVMFSISLNGSLYGFFPSSRGLRQGDPLSPYLFVIVMEVWRILLHKRIQDATNFQYHWKCKEQGILNLCFADDVLLFCKGNVQSVSVIKKILDEFAAASGLRINPNKSQIILSRAAQAVRHEIVHVMRFQEGVLPLKYLGVPLVSSKLSIADCCPLLQNIDDRLAGWRNLNLSFAGRVQLIKSVLSAMHVYWASVFLLPKRVINDIEGRMRRFLWYGSSETGVAKVSWEQVCKPKEKGGLGIRRVLHMNQALMLKHVWKILQEDRSSIWAAWVLQHRLKKHTLWTTNVATAPWCWKQITKICHLLKSGLEYRVGNGAKFKLWQDLWHERGPLLTHYPRGPLITGLPADSLVKEVLHQGCWTWPSETDIDIAEIIANLPTVYTGESDTILLENYTWKLHFCCCVCYIGASFAYSYVVFLLGGKFKIPRHLFILWLAIKGRLSTMDRPWMNHRDDGCVLCNFAARESHSHLFFSCLYSRRCLAILKEKVRFNWPMKDWNQGITWASRKWRGKHLWHAASKALLASIVYHIWTERNYRKFKDTSTPAETVAVRAIESVRLRIISEEIPSSLQAFTLYRNWQIPWHRALF
ncbi:UNVERIFIED_CONTAM: hypothetical protein Sradi_7219000 [Sesamum radiatum]|uniref:Reverse transcriptase domain-containing protein n=1 Tax=Sesamum radiatum TaxID=300843 RepID=A0AAW2IP05_SESRA